MTYLPPVEANAYENQRRRARDTYQGGLAGIEQQRGDAQAANAFNQGQLATRWDKVRERLPGAYIRRGMQNSGVFRRGMKDYAQGRQQSQQGLALQFQQMMNRLNQQGLAAGIQFNNTVGDTYDQEAIRRAQIAAALEGL